MRWPDCPVCGALCTFEPMQVVTGAINQDVICPNHGVVATHSTNTEERNSMPKTKNPGKHAKQAAKKKTNGKAHDHHQPDPAAVREARNDSERASRFKKLEGLERRAQLKYSAYTDLKEATSEAKEEYEAILTEMRSVIRGEDTKPILELAENAGAEASTKH